MEFLQHKHFVREIFFLIIMDNCYMQLMLPGH